MLLTPIAGKAAEGRTLVVPPRGHTFGVHRVTARELAVFLPGTQLGEPSGIAVTRLVATDDPATTGDDDEVTLVALDQENGVLLSNLGLLKVGQWDGSGGSLGGLLRPTDVAIDRAGTIAITDTGNRRIVLLQHHGDRMEEVAALPGFLEPTGITADGRGGFFVCDRRFQAVFHVDPATGKRTTFGLEVGFERPIDVATVPSGDRLANGKKRPVVIVDQDGLRLRVFDPAGALKATRLASSLSVADARFDAVDVDYYGNIFAVDRAGNRVHKFRDDLYVLDTLGGEDDPLGFRAPRGIAIHRRLGQVFIAEESGGTYVWIGADVVKLRVTEAAGAAAFDYVLTEDSLVNARVLDPQGRPQAELLTEVHQAAGPQSGRWDGTNAQGKRLPAGEYLVELRARATYASKSSNERRLLRAFTLRNRGPGSE